MRRSALLVVVALVGSILLAGSLVVLDTEPTEPTVEKPSDPKPPVFHFEGQDSGIWPYLSPSQSFRKRSPINVIVRERKDNVIRALRKRTDTNWTVVPPDEGHANASDFVPEKVNLTGTEVAWSDTVGTTRYAYVTDGERQRWIRETEQLHDGDYYGYRTHIRLYASPDEKEPWVAMQVHTEHFDWFTLRHAVDGVEAGQRQVELEFMDATFVEDVWRVHLNNDGPSDADGWATVVELLTLPGVLVGALSMRRLWHQHLTSVDRARLRTVRDRLDPTHALLVGSVVGLVLGVRAGGILLERHLGVLTMHMIAGLLYPFLGIGIPLVTAWFAGYIDRRLDAAVTAAGGLALALFLDYSYLGIETLPIEVVLQRTSLVLVIGVIAAGAARPAGVESRRRDVVVVGFGLWVAILSATLLQWI